MDSRWPGKLISVVEVSENEDMSHSQIYGSEEETENHDFKVTVKDLNEETTRYYYRYLVWNKYHVENKFVMEIHSFTKVETRPEYVDLGLPSGLLWATCNVGADKPEGFGVYFSWGETLPKIEYSWNQYQYCVNGDKYKLTKYCNNSSYGYNGFTDTLTTLHFSDDAAEANLGGDWRMPTKEEWDKLCENTTNTWTTKNGVYGMLFTAANGASLFLPAAGYCYDNSLYFNGTHGYYWSSTLTSDPQNGYHHHFDSANCNRHYGERSLGYSVRPVFSVRHI